MLFGKQIIHNNTLYIQIINIYNIKHRTDTMANHLNFHKL